MDVQEFFTELYENFNRRNIETVIACMTPDVKWANGMEGGFVFGHEAVREYWMRQFTLISSQVTPIEITQMNNQARIKVHQAVHDLEGKLLADELVTHLFVMRDDKIAQFDIEK